MQVLHGFKFKVEPLGDHTFEVEPQKNVDQGAGLQKVQTQDSMDYQLARNMDQHLACELFRFREDGNEAAFAIAAKAGLKDDMDARSDVYMLSNDCRKCSDDSDGYYWEYTQDKAKGNVLGMKIIRDQSEMGRAKLRMELIKKEKTRITTYHKRKLGILKKASEFSILCDVDTIMIITPPNSIYPSINERQFVDTLEPKENEAKTRLEFMKRSMNINYPYMLNFGNKPTMVHFPGLGLGELDDVQPMKPRQVMNHWFCNDAPSTSYMPVKHEPVVGYGYQGLVYDNNLNTFLSFQRPHLVQGEMDLFSLIRAPNPTKVKTGSRPRAPHELPLLTLTASRVIEMDEPAETAAPDVPLPEEVPISTVPGGDQAAPVAVEPPTVQESRKRGHEGIDANAPPKSLRRDHADLQPSGIPADVSDPDPLAFADAPSPHPAEVIRSSQGVAAARDPSSENVSSPTEVGSPRCVYRPEWGVTNGSLLDTPEACQDLVDHAAPPGYFFELRHMHNDNFLGQYNINLARQVAMGSQLRLRFEQEAKLLRKSVAQMARREQRIQARESEIKSLEALLEIEADMKRAAEEKSAGLSQELERMLSGEETLKAAFEDYKQHQDQMVEQRCAEMDARLDAMSIDFDEELYPHMLTAIAGRRWVIGHRLRLATMKCVESLEMRQAFTDVVSAGIAKGMSEGLKHGVEHGHAQRTIESLEAYDPEAEAKFAAAFHSSQLAIPVYPEVRDPWNPWACTEEIKLADAIAANISRAEQKKRSRIVCRTHGVGSAHHARSDRVLVSAPIVVPQGLALILVDAAMQTDPDA
nr:transcription factor, MADS-box [Tanacetum cinerariifolium]